MLEFIVVKARNAENENSEKPLKQNEDSEVINITYALRNPFQENSASCITEEGEIKKKKNHYFFKYLNFLKY